MSPTGATVAYQNGVMKPSDSTVAIHWHVLDTEEALRRLDSSPSGLSEDEARRRLSIHGPNEIASEVDVPWWKIVIQQFRDPLIYILLVAALVTLALREFVDSGVILAVVIINAIIGFTQQVRAQQAMKALSRMSAPRADVMRDGRPAQIAAVELVPGDVVLLQSGDRVAADLRLIGVHDLEADESALTGESVPVRKQTDPLNVERLVPGDQVNLAFAGTTISRGRATGVVIRTGAFTELGGIARSVREIGRTTTPLEEKMTRFGRQVAIACAGLSVVILVIGLIRSMPPAEIFLVAVAVAVAAIPEGLPVVLTVTLAIGVRRMAARNAIVRALPSVETLGSTTVIGSDKTGTLTRNEMMVRAIWAGGVFWDVSGNGYDPEGTITARDDSSDQTREAVRQTLRIGVLANEADPQAFDEDRMGDPTEIALHVAARKEGIDPSSIRTGWRELGVRPFEPELRYMASLREHDGRRFVMVKGAPEVVIALCTRQLSGTDSIPVDPRLVHAAASELAREGLRLLAMAFKETSAEALSDRELAGDFVLAGLQGMEDPPRPEALEAVASTKESGIRVLMITGDHLDTARAIGRQFGLGGAEGRAIEGIELDELDDAELDEIVREVDIYARVAPVHKYRIVERLKKMGHVVAVTGDGVNDAPALRAAHIGVAMGRSGTAVAREASAIVLADDNFATLTAAIEEGRVVFSNIRKVTFFLLSSAVGVVLTILVAIIGGWPLPFIAAQILWINMVTNGLQDIALAFEPGEPGIRKRPPRKLSEGVLTPQLMQRLVAVGIVMATGSLLTFWWVLDGTGDLVVARSAALTQMVMFQFLHVLNCRSLDRSIFTVPFFSNPFLFVSVAAAACAHWAALYLEPLQRIFRTAPLNADHWVFILFLSVAVVAGGELDKWRNRRAGTPIG
jgi:magnesium-transporting ATPase (P-type)